MLSRTLVRAAARPSLRSASAPSLSRAAHDHAHADSNAGDVFPEEGFNAPFWRNGVIFALSLALVYRLTPAASADSNEESPITKYLAFHMPDKQLWVDRSVKHLEMAKQAADDRLLFQEAESSKVKRIKYPGVFQQASPNFAVGSQADLSDLVIKSERDDFAFGKQESAEDDE
ncbi:hypothetical protein MNV49_005600 [Pseudohyphozyma bogoriensis]|nr:hypothetical protein MNV49_005600 [Pseudohyphozyma bogoriensis]